MGSIVNIHNRFNNPDKRYAEAVVMTCPALVTEGSPRSGSGPTYIKSGDAWTAQVIEKDSVLKKVYLIVDEAFPTGATLDVDIAGVAYFTSAAIDSKGVTVSTIEDALAGNKQTITASITSGASGTDVTEGKLRIMVDSVSLSVKNGNYIA